MPRVSIGGQILGLPAWLPLWVLVLATTIGFWRAQPLAGALLTPYLGWVTFACALAWATWQQNPRLPG